VWAGISINFFGAAYFFSLVIFFFLLCVCLPFISFTCRVMMLVFINYEKAEAVRSGNESLAYDIKRLRVVHLRAIKKQAPGVLDVIMLLIIFCSVNGDIFSIL
jgi:hypothetical protein